MAGKTNTEVIIGGKIFTLSGEESEEYLQRVASYLNAKNEEFAGLDSFRRQTSQAQTLQLELNIANDYFQEKEKVEALEEELETKNKELYDLKHELITVQIRLDSLQKQQSARTVPKGADAD